MLSFRAYVVGAAVLHLAACSFDQSGIGPGGGDGGGGNPDAQRFDADPNAPDAAPGQIDAFVPQFDATPPDGDNDGVPDFRDNCPQIGNPDQYDEDDDTVGDACDNCPHVSNTGQQDVGESNIELVADGIGDACDPRPNAPGDSMIVFDGFNGDTLNPAWTAGPGTGSDEWALSGDGYLLQPNASVGSRSLLWTSNSPSIAAADTALQLDAIADVGGMNDNSRTAGVLGAFADTGEVGTGYACFQYIATAVPNPTNFTLLALFNSTTYDTLASLTNPWGFTTNERYEYRLMWNGIFDEQECTVNHTSADAVTASDTDSTFLSGNAGLRTYGVSARFEYFVLYQLGL